MAGVTLFSIFYFFLALFQCSPVDYFWNRKTPETEMISFFRCVHDPASVVYIF